MPKSKLHTLSFNSNFLSLKFIKELTCTLHLKKNERIWIKLRLFFRVINLNIFLAEFNPLVWRLNSPCQVGEVNGLESD